MGGLSGRLDETTFHDLSASAVRIGDQIIENAYDSESLHAGAMLLGLGEGFRLKTLDLSEPEAHQSRLRAAQGLELMGLHRRSFDLGMNIFFNALWIMGVPLILFWTVLPVLLGIVLEFIQVRRKRSKPPVWKFNKACVLIDIGLLFFLILLVVLEFFKKRPEGELPLFLLFTSAVFTSWSAMGLSSFLPFARLRQFRLWIAVLCGSLWFKGSVFWTAGRLSIAMPDHLRDWFVYFTFLLIWSILCVLICIEMISRPSAPKTRRLNGVALMTHWIVVLMFFHVFGLACAPMERLVTNSLALYQPLPRATEETYNRVVLGKWNATTPLEPNSDAGIPRRLFWAAPEDVKNFITQRRETRESIPDDRLLYLLRNCNRDLRNILLGELADPNAYEVLLIRAEWGDRAAKEQLEAIYQEKLDDYIEAEPEPLRRDPFSLGELLELAGTLAHVSDGSEGQQRLSFLMDDVVERTQSLGTGPKLTDPRHAERIVHPFWWALGELPGNYATPLVKSYLQRTRFVNLFGDQGQDIRKLANLLANGDRELAEDIVVALAGLPVEETSPNTAAVTSGYTPSMRLTRHRDRNSPYCLEAIFTHLSVESIPLLLEHLDSGNEQLRAFIVWRLTSLGYEWPDERIQALQKDSDWRIRVNALFAADAEELTEAVNDESAIVRVIAQLIRQAQPS